MAKRQTDTKIWTTQRWFKKLHPNYKLAWKYLTDMCDHAGIWKIDVGQLIEDTGIEDFNLKSFIVTCNQDFDKENGEKISRERIKLVNKNIVWLTGFIRFQYETKDFTINPAVPAINSALTILNGYGILQEGLDKGYYTLSKPYTKGTVRTIDRDIDRDKNVLEDVEEDKGGTGEEEEEEGDCIPVIDRTLLGVVVYDAEKEVLANPIAFEQICVATGKDPTLAKESLRLYHLYLLEKEQYPKGKRAIFAGFEKWLRNEKKFSNGHKSNNAGSQQTKRGTSVDRIETAKKW